MACTETALNRIDNYYIFSLHSTSYCNLDYMDTECTFPYILYRNSFNYFNSLHHKNKYVGFNVIVYIDQAILTCGIQKQEYKFV